MVGIAPGKNNHPSAFELDCRQNHTSRVEVKTLIYTGSNHLIWVTFQQFLRQNRRLTSGLQIQSSSSRNHPPSDPSFALSSRSSSDRPHHSRISFRSSSTALVQLPLI